MEMLPPEEANPLGNVDVFCHRDECHLPRAVSRPLKPIMVRRVPESDSPVESVRFESCDAFLGVMLRAGQSSSE